MHLLLPSACADPRADPQMLDYNVPGGKLNRGMAVRDVLTALKQTAVRSQPSQLVEDSTHATNGGSDGECGLEFRHRRHNIRHMTMGNVSCAGAEHRGGVFGERAGLVHRVGTLLPLALRCGQITVRWDMLCWHDGYSYAC